jgi:hypothetical protein
MGEGGELVTGVSNSLSFSPSALFPRVYDEAVKEYTTDDGE